MGESSAKQQDEARARELYGRIYDRHVAWFVDDSPIEPERPSLEDITAAFDEVRREAVEACAKVADAEAARWWGDEYHSTPQQAEHAFKAECLEQFASRIRSLASEPPGQPGESGDP